jgi:hypothetical protein
MPGPWVACGWKAYDSSKALKSSGA